MTVAQLGIKVSVDGAEKAAVDLDKLEGAAAKAEKGAEGVGRAAKDLSGSLQVITGILQAVERNTAAMAAAQAKAATATAQVEAAARSAASSITGAAVASKSLETEQQAVAAAAAHATSVVRSSVAANDNATSALVRHAQAIQALTAAESRMTAGGYASRAEDVAAYGRSLDDLRAKFNPTFAVIRQYREQVEQIRQANRIGAISTQEMTAALSAERKAALASIQAIRERNTALGSSVSGNGNASYSSNIAAQIQDTVVSAYGGMSAGQIGLQQGTQLAAVFQDLRTQGMSTGAALASAFGATLNPISLATIGVVALTAATIQYLSGASEVQKLDDVLKKHADNIAALKEAYGTAADGVRAYINESTDVAIAKMRASTEAMREILKTQTASISATLSTTLKTSAYDSSLAGYESFKSAIEALSTAAKSGEPGILAFRQAVARVGEENQADKSVQALVNRFLELTDGASQAERGIEGSNRALSETARAAAGASEAVREYRDALKDLSGIALPTLSPTQQANEAYSRALEKASSPGARASADASYQAALERIKAREQEAADEKARREADRGARSASREAERDARQRVESYERLTESARQYIEQQELERRTIGLTAEEAARLRYEQNMLQQATNDNIVLTPKQAEELKALAEQMAETETATAKMRDAYENTKDTATGFFRDIASNLRQGEDAWGSFAGAAVNALNKVLDKVLEVGTSSLIDGIFGGAKGGSGFFSSILSFLTPSANGNVFSGGNVIPFAKGGVVTGPTLFPMANGAGLMGEAGPEAVMPLRRGPDGRLGVAGAGGSGMTDVRVSVSVDDDGKIQAYVASMGDRAASNGAAAGAAMALRQVPALAVQSVQNHQRRFG